MRDGTKETASRLFLGTSPSGDTTTRTVLRFFLSFLRKQPNDGKITGSVKTDALGDVSSLMVMVRRRPPLTSPQTGRDFLAYQVVGNESTPPPAVTTCVEGYLSKEPRSHAG